MSIKNSSDTIGNRTGDLPAGIAMLQLTACSAKQEAIFVKTAPLARSQTLGSQKG